MLADLGYIATGRFVAATPSAVECLNLVLSELIPAYSSSVGAHAWLEARPKSGGDAEDGDIRSGGKEGAALADLVFRENLHEHPVVREHRVNLLLRNL